MKFLRYICLIILFLPLAGNSQHLLSGNFVPNPSFEEYDSCPPPPCGTGSLEYCKDWFSEYGDGGSSDYYNSNCTSCPTSMQMINFQHPRSGDAFAGILLFVHPMPINIMREYIEVKLTEKLYQSKMYCCEYYVSLFNPSTYAIENINMYFSKNLLLKNNTNLFAIQPQIKNNRGIVIDTINWVKINGLLYANGNENYITIGNFDSSQHTNYNYVNYGVMHGYYFIDDVSVCECSFDINLGADTALCESETIILNPNLPNATYTWQDSSHAATYEVKQPGTYWVRAYVAEYDITSTDTIVISAGDDNICNPPLTIPNIITPNGDSQNDNFVIQNSESYEIALQIYNRWGNIIYESTSYQNDFSCNNCADGVYFYVLKAKSKRNGREKEYKGSLTVIK